VKTIAINGHKLEISSTSLTAKEVIKYDGNIVSDKRSVSGATHIFNVKENDEDVQYEVEIGFRWHMCSAWATVRRNGVVIFSDR
jgi:hypothetical protein